MAKARHRLIGRYDPKTLEEARLAQRRTYTICDMHDACKFYRETNTLCLDTPDQCPVLKSYRSNEARRKQTRAAMQG